MYTLVLGMLKYEGKMLPLQTCVLELRKCRISLRWYLGFDVLLLGRCYNFMKAIKTFFINTHEQD